MVRAFDKPKGLSDQTCMREGKGVKNSVRGGKGSRKVGKKVKG